MRVGWQGIVGIVLGGGALATVLAYSAGVGGLGAGAAGAGGDDWTRDGLAVAAGTEPETRTATDADTPPPLPTLPEDDAPVHAGDDVRPPAPATEAPPAACAVWRCAARAAAPA